MNRSPGYRPEIVKLTLFRVEFDTAPHLSFCVDINLSSLSQHVVSSLLQSTTLLAAICLQALLVALPWHLSRSLWPNEETDL